MNITKRTKKSISPKQAKVNTTAKEIETIDNTGEILEDIKPSGRKEQWGKLKRKSRMMWGLLDLARRKDESIISAGALQRFYESGDVLLFKHNHTKGTKKLHQAFFSKHKLDPLSAHRKGLILFAQTTKVVDLILARKPSTRFIFLTLTTRNVKADDVMSAPEVINKELDRYYTGFRRIFGHSSEVISAARDFNKQIEGTIKYVELSYNNEEDSYHVHAHILLAVKPDYFLPQHYMTHEKLRELWAKAADLDYLPFVNVQTVKGYGNQLKGAIAEISKYPLKPASVLDLPKEKGAEVVGNIQLGLFNRRLITFTGIFRQIRRELKLQDIETHSLIHVDEEGISEDEKGDFIEFYVYRYSASLGDYVCSPYSVVKALDEEYFRERHKEKILKEYGLTG